MKIRPSQIGAIAATLIYLGLFGFIFYMAIQEGKCEDRGFSDYDVDGCYNRVREYENH